MASPGPYKNLTSHTPPLLHSAASKGRSAAIYLVLYACQAAPPPGSGAQLIGSVGRNLIYHRARNDADSDKDHNNSQKEGILNINISVV